MPNRPGQGRKPKPTALKLLGGNAGKRAITQAEPRYAVRLPPCPSHLNKAARTEWRRVGRILLAQGVITDADRSALAGYCQTYARWVEAELKLQQFGMLLTVDGALSPSPYLRIAERALEQMHRFAVEFGLTPSSRSRVKAGRGQQPADDPFGEFIGNG